MIRRGLTRFATRPAAPAADDFYSNFWSLQRFFSNPPLLFAPTPAPVASTSAAAAPTEPFAALQHGLAKTLAEFAAATKKEKALSGKADGKQKAVAVLPEVAAEQVAAELGSEGERLDHYFFPKFLTSRNLLSLEVSGPAMEVRPYRAVRMC